MNESIAVLKLDFEGAIKRMRTTPKSYAELKQLIADSFPAAAESKIHYQDSDGDKIGVTCDADLQEAFLQLQEAKLSVMKFYVTAPPPESAMPTKSKPKPKAKAKAKAKAGPKVESPPGPSKESQAKPEKNPKGSHKKQAEEAGLAKLVKKVAEEEIQKRREEIKERTRLELGTTQMMPDEIPSGQSGLPVHATVTCDGCEKCPIVGVRYKCVQCPNYDLCADCEAKHIHSHHLFTKINTPDQAQVAREANLGTAIVVDVPPGLVPSLKGAPVADILNQLAKAQNPQKQETPEEVKEQQNKLHRRQAQVVGGKEKRVLETTSAPDFIFAANWILENNSKKPWPQHVCIVKAEGNIDFETVQYPVQLQPRESTALELLIKAPHKPGKYTLKLALQNEAGVAFGQQLVVKLKVKPPGDKEEELAYQAIKMEDEGLGTFDACYEALVAAKGNPTVAQATLKKS